MSSGSFVQEDKPSILPPSSEAELIIDVDADEAEYLRAQSSGLEHSDNVQADGPNYESDDDEFDQDPFRTLPGVVVEGGNHVNGPDDDYSNEMIRSADVSASAVEISSKFSTAEATSATGNGFVSISDSVAALSSYSPPSQSTKVTSLLVYII